MARKIKTSLQEWMDYLNEPWPDDWYVEDELVLVNGAEHEEPTHVESLKALPIDSVVEVISGWIRFNDKERPGRLDEMPLLDHLARWLRSRKRLRLVIEIERDKRELLMEALDRLPFKTKVLAG